MVDVLAVLNRKGRKVRLSRERWKHIVSKHPDMADQLEEVRIALARPSVTVPDPDRTTKLR